MERQGHGLGAEQRSGRYRAMTWANHFLDALDEADVRALRPHLTRVTLARNDILDEPGEPVGHVYLPIDCILSVVTVMRSGAQVESRTIGRESGYGLLHALGSSISFERMLVQVGGEAWRLPVKPLREAAVSSKALLQSIVQHAQASIIQSAQSTACNSLHAAEQRLCRWLLMTQDRLGSDMVPLTQEHLAIMLGVQRTTVTAIASHLQDRGAISYVRGKITVLDRPALERGACECYRAIEHGVAQMLGDAELDLPRLR
jgi:CRP-like cAMP-binding protein